MSAHEQFLDDLALYALGTLGESERAALEAHLAQCAACRRELQELWGDIGLLGLTTIGATPPPHARARLLSALAKEPRVRMIAGIGQMKREHISSCGGFRGLLPSEELTKFLK